MESLLQVAAAYVTLALQAVAIVIVAFGSARAVVNITRGAFSSHPGAVDQRAEWLDYARWLVAALTFQLAADIVATSFAPTWDELGRLVVVAVVRTFLSYFLDREMEHAARLRAVSSPGMPPASPPRSD
jgi:uncharacterized membrane protein